MMDRCPRNSVSFGPNQGIVRKPNIAITRGKITRWRMRFDCPSFAFGTDGARGSVCPSFAFGTDGARGSVCPSFVFGTDVTCGSVSFGPNQGIVRKPNIIILLNIPNTTLVILSLALIAMYFSMFDLVVGVKKFLNFKLFSVGLKKSKTSCSWTAVSDFVFVLCTLCGLISSSDRFDSLHCLINDSQF